MDDTTMNTIPRISFIRKIFQWITHNFEIHYSNKAEWKWIELNIARAELNNVELRNLPKLCQNSWAKRKLNKAISSQWIQANLNFSLKKQQPWHKHYARERFQKLDFVTFYLNTVFYSCSFCVFKKKVKLKHAPLWKRITKTETLDSGTHTD